MHTPDEHESHDKKASMKEGYEVTDVSVQGIMVFLVGLFVSVGVFFVLCFGLGKVINYALVKRDGPANKWNATNIPQPGKLEMESNPAQEQQKLQLLTQKFPTPRLETDDGNQDLASLHGREDLLLDHYTWVDNSHTKVRIPIERAMELIAQRGLPVAQQPAQSEPLMAGESRPVLQAPLTDGFARTGFEQQEMGPTRLPGEQASTKANNR
jgi:tRNA(Leu) C34 or U34 (ribose-2'-O)-methylase TrmL